MKTTKVVFLGSRPLGLKALNIIEEIEGVEIVGCVTREPTSTAWWDIDPHKYCSKYKRLELDDLKNIDFDFGVSINYWKIMPKEIIEKPGLGFINLHHSFNLAYRGRDMNTHALRNARNKNQWYHGTCLHYTDDGLDTGPIINSMACDITEFDTAWSLFNKVEDLGENILKEWLPRLVRNKAPVSFPEPEQPISFRKEIKKEINISNPDKIQTYDFVRSLDFNNHYEPAYYFLDEEKVYLTTNSDFGSDVLLDAGNGRLVYINTKYSDEK